MKIKVTETVHVRQEKEIEYDLPVKPMYYFITGERKSYAVIPQFTSWDGKNDLYEYNIIKLGQSFECTVDYFTVRVHEIPDVLKDHKHQGNRIIEQLVKWPNDDHRTKQQFKNDLDMVINQLSLAFMNKTH